ncbi:MAG: ABC transporter permease [Coprobacillus sp.]|nr:ABC transporter permease [Coprobacillus sp.]
MKKITLTGILARKTTRSIKNNWGQFLSIILITAIAVTLFLGLSANAESFKDRINRLYEECNVADIWITTDGESEADTQYISSLLNESDSMEVRGYIPATFEEDSAYMVTTDVMPTINAPYIVDSLFDDEGEDFFIVDEALVGSDVSLTGLTLGSEVNVSISASLLGETVKSYLGNESLITMTFTINGMMEYAENVSTSTYNSSTFFVSTNYFKNELKSAISEMIGTSSSIIDALIDDYSLNNQMIIKTGKHTKVSNLLSDINGYYSSGENEATLMYLYDLDNAPFNIIVQADADQAVALSYAFSFIFFFVALLVILTTMSQLIVKERQEIGTLKAIGMSSQRIFASYLILMLVLVGIGLVIGMILGPLLLPSIMDIKYSILYTLPAMRYVFPWVYFVATLGVLVVLTALVVYIACRSELRLNPASSMRPPIIKPLRPKDNKDKKPKFLYFKMAMRNIRLHPAKSVMVVVGILGCTALLVCGYGIDDTLDHSIDYDIKNFYNADVTLTYSTGTESQLELLYQYDEIEYAEEVASTSITVIGENKGSTTMMDTNLYVLPMDHQFQNVEFDSGTIAISSKVSKDAGIDVGDTITFETVDETFTGTVGVVYKTFVFHGILVSSSNEAYAPLYSNISTAYINVKDGVNNEDFALMLKNDLSFVSSTTTYAETYDYINSIISSISFMTLTIKIFAILLAVVVLFNLTYLNFKDRTREIATLKVTGFSTVDIAKTLIYESLILVLIGAVIGLAAGFPMEILVLFVNRNSLVEFLYTVSAWTMILSFIITIGTAIIINIILATRIRKVPMVESLKSVE